MNYLTACLDRFLNYPATQAYRGKKKKRFSKHQEIAIFAMEELKNAVYNL